MRIKSVDLVFLLDLSGGMAECIDSVKSGCCIMLNELIKARSDQSYPYLTSLRFKVCGYRNHPLNSENWFVDNPFVSDLVAAEAQFSGVNMQAAGGCEEEAGSLLDALFRLSKMEQTEDGVPECSSKWRARGRYGRTIFFITNSTFKDPMTIPEAAGGSLPDVKNAIREAKISLCGFCPETDNYCMLGGIGRSQLEFYVSPDTCPALVGLGKGGEEWNAATQIASHALLNLNQEIYRKLALIVIKSHAKACYIDDLDRIHSAVNPQITEYIARENDSEIRRIRLER